MLKVFPSEVFIKFNISTIDLLYQITVYIIVIYLNISIVMYLAV